MTPSDIRVLQAELKALHKDLSEAVRELKEQHGSIETHTAEALERIETQVKATNGRVSALELGQARLKGGLFVLGLMAPAVTAVAVDYILN